MDKKTGPKADDPIKIAFVTNNPAAFWTIAQRGTEKAAKDFKVEVVFKRPPSPGTAAPSYLSTVPVATFVTVRSSRPSPSASARLTRDPPREVASPPL